jgi:hypothetical protein
VSKKHGHRKKRRKKSQRKGLCPVYSTQELLAEVAWALTACEVHGLPVKLRHGIVMTREGYVVDLPGGRWGARTLIYTEFSSAGDSDDD